MKSRIHHVIVLDKSGSMGAYRSETVEMFNGQVEQIRNLGDEYDDIEHRVTLTLFNQEVQHVFTNRDPSLIDEYTVAGYRPQGYTALHDAVGQTIARVREEVGENEHVLMTVITDGQENSSQEYSWDTVRDVIEEITAKNWTITYIGTTEETMRQGRQMGISQHNTMSMGATGQSVNTRGAGGMSTARAAYTDDVSQGKETRDDYMKGAEDEMEEEDEESS